MSPVTNKLVGKAGRFGAPAGAAVVLVLAATMFVHHNGVHAAMISSPAPMDDNSVSALVSLDNAVEAVASRVSPAVVNIQVTSRGSSEHETGGEQDQSQQGEMQGLPPGFAQFFGQGGPFGQGMQRPQQPQIEHGIGSGVIISPDGYIVTNNHVVDGAMEVRGTLTDPRTFPAKEIGTTKLIPGQSVLAIGSPFGYYRDSVTRGIVSATNRANPYTDDPRKPGGFIQ